MRLRQWIEGLRQKGSHVEQRPWWCLPGIKETSLGSGGQGQELGPKLQCYRLWPWDCWLWCRLWVLRYRVDKSRIFSQNVIIVWEWTGRATHVSLGSYNTVQQNGCSLHPVVLDPEREWDRMVGMRNMNECIRLRGFWDSQMELLGRELKVHVWSSDEGTWSLEIIVV